MSDATYYRDHWVEVEPERVEAYEQMFQWRPQMEPLLEPAELGPGQRIVDYGCGPGMLTLELARRVGDAGHVHGLDLNALFLERAEERLSKEGLSERASFHRILQDRVPLDDSSVDRVICKNVLEYVDDPRSTLEDFRRILRSGGLVHAIDSDWGLLAVEPIGPERIARLFEAASVAYRTPLIGRKLYGLMKSAGFREVRVRVLAGPDTRGHFAPILFNMASYARQSGRMAAAEIDSLTDEVRAAIEDGTYLLVLPQFLVTGVA